LESITVTSNEIKGDVIMGILAHQQTLKVVGTFAPSEAYEYEESPKSVDDPPVVSIDSANLQSIEIIYVSSI
jgi:hypothetical protein